tara:strand:- start:2305 stop:2670 length:366 start_codon:yes stop_codon:yes gene_type:complete
VNKSKIKTICFDIDGVICTTALKTNYNKSKPIKKNIKMINFLYKKGFKIVLHTARYMGKCNNDRYLAERKIKNHTLKQLKTWGVLFHEIYFGKPSFDIVIDDKAISFNKNWNKILIKNLDL